MATAWVDINGLDRVNGWKLFTKHGLGATQVLAMPRATIEELETPPTELIPGWSDLLKMMNLAEQATAQHLRAIEAKGGRTLTSLGVIMQKAYGWPCRSLYWNWDNGVNQVNTRPGEPITRAIRLPQRQAQFGTLSLDERRALPLAVIPIGFAMNTLLYAAAMWLLIPGPFALRRAIRRRQGRCVACGYDLRGAEHERCSECGLEVAGT